MDLSNYSDEELESIANEDFSSYSDEELEKIASEKQQKPIGQQILSAASTAVSALDRLGPAQLRNLTALALGQKENTLQNNIEMLTGANAPSFGQIASKAGVPDFNFNLQADTENLQGFNTFPVIPEQEKRQLMKTEATVPTSELVGAGLDFTVGAKAGEKVLKSFGSLANLGARGLDVAKNKAGQSLFKQAGDLAEKATGATGAQAEKFRPNAGRELLDRGLVKFGDSPADIAERLQGKIKGAESVLDQSLKELDSMGAKVSVENIINNLQAKAQALAKDPSQAGVVKQINSIIDDIVQSGESFVPISEAEKTKRGFDKMSRNWLDEKVGQAGKAAYRTYKTEVEEVAKKTAPEIAQKFKESKELYGLLNPIQEAAARRASTLNQSPIGGLLDVATAGIPADPVNQMALATTRRAIAPRIASSVAVSADKISSFLLNSPQIQSLKVSNPDAFAKLVSNLTQGLNFKPQEQKGLYDKDKIMSKVQGSQYAKVLQDAAQKGDQSFAAAHYVMSSNDEKYRQLVEDQEQ